MTNRLESPGAPGYQVPDKKKTVLELYATAREAHAMWEADPDRVRILDVRTREEFVFVGHAPMAWNIPFGRQTDRWDADKRTFTWELDADFAGRVKRWARPEDTILVMCRSGGRSAMAVNQLAAAGLTRVFNVIDGMEGDAVADPDSVFLGQRLKNGWKNSGCPWTYTLVPERMLLSPDQA